MSTFIWFLVLVLAIGGLSVAYKVFEAVVRHLAVGL
jgi:hypothetical protein